MEPSDNTKSNTSSNITHFVEKQFDDGNGILLTPRNAFEYFKLSSPFLIIFFLLLTSVLNQDIKVLIFLLGFTIASMINIFIMNLIDDKDDNNSSSNSILCNVFAFPFTKSNTGKLFKSPSMTAMFISFTLVYITLPMHFNPPHSLNIPLILVLSVLLVIDIFTQSKEGCSHYLGSFFGILVGLFLGSLWYAVINSSEYRSLLYYSEFTGNKTVCRRPRKQYFKCDVFRNGKLIQASRF